MIQLENQNDEKQLVSFAVATQSLENIENFTKQRNEVYYKLDVVVDRLQHENTEQSSILDSVLCL